MSVMRNPVIQLVGIPVQMNNPISFLNFGLISLLREVKIDSDDPIEFCFEESDTPKPEIKLTAENCQWDNGKQWHDIKEGNFTKPFQ